MHRSGGLAALLAGALIAAAANAQAPADPASAAQASARPAGPAASTPLYQVEIIVFAYNDADPTEEVFADSPPPNPDPAFEDGLIPLQTLDLDAAAQELSAFADEAQAGTAFEGSAEAGNDGAAGTEESAAENAPGPALAPPGADTSSLGASPASPQSAAPNGEAAPPPAPLIGPQGFRVLGADALTLDDAYAKLSRIDAYTPLLHAAWIQPALPENKAPAVSMTDLGSLNPMGNIRVYESRYLHVTLDLRFRPTSAQLAGLEQASLARSRPAGAPIQGGAAGPATGVGVAGIGIAGVGANEALNEISLGPQLTMKTSRRVDAGKMQYFDHPYFGVLVLITSYEPKNETRTAGVKPAA